MFREKQDPENTEKVVEERFRLLVEVGSKTMADSELPEMDLPAYYDADKFRVGQTVFYNNVFTMMVAKLAGLLSLLAVPSILDILIFTKQSGTPCTAFRRYVSTILHTFIWYEREPEKQKEFFASLKNVRRKHCVASKRASEAGINRISQFDMAVTQFGFIGFTILCGDELGVAVSRKDLEGLIHLWRVIGSMLGIEERFNICTGSVEETKALCARILDEVFLPCLAAKRPEFEKMRQILLEGVWPISPQIDPDAFTAITYRLAMSATSNNNHSLEVDTSSMSSYSKSLLGFQTWVHKNLLQTSLWWSPIFRGFFNAQMRLSIFLTEHWPFLAYLVFGKQRSQVNIYKMQID
ncbi:uncharacterized protein LOC124183527 isoform X1 [Neodiprion fabricii]|uniref:uncharacterized protein LOC124183527 isoform X1 n=1 Tax=Neodiprion fabricii TaxID=2872261 RepID=UPI001ED8FA6F|nr:uncharacterized protein LOC124183527 isoform X1 [Neodiprion fabricii]